MLNNLEISKKEILKGNIIVFENNDKGEMGYLKLENTSSIIRLWSGFRYSPKVQNITSDVEASLGTSFYYKFKYA